MKVTREELIETRMNLLKQMDLFVRNNFDEDIILDIWLVYGLKEGWDDYIIQLYAEDESAWLDCCNAFNASYKKQISRNLAGMEDN